MTYRISGNDVKEGSTTVAKVKKDEIYDGSNHLMCKIKDNGEIYDDQRHKIGKLCSNGDICNDRNQRVAHLRDAKRMFSHPDDRIAAALYLKLAA